MDDFNGRVIAVTGAAHGLGEATAHAFAARGARLAICDIDGEALDEVREALEKRGTEVLTCTVDVTRADQFKEFSRQVYERFGGVDVLVNNAGVVLFGPMKDMTLEDWQWIIGINLWGIIHGTHFFLPGMMERGSGHIVNIASAAGLLPMPMLSAYSGTKSAVVSMTRVWRGEGAARGVGFTAICPGMMNTNIARSIRMCTGEERKAIAEPSWKATKFLSSKRYDPSTIAEAIIRAVEKNRSVVPVGFETRLLALADRISWRLVDFFIRISTRLGKRLA